MKLGASLPDAVAQAEALLVGADGGDDHFLGHFEEGRVERAHHHHRPLDEAGDFLEQALVVDDAQPLREGEVVGIGADDLLAPVDIEHDLGLFERLHVVVEALHPDRRRARGSGGHRWSGRW